MKQKYVTVITALLLSVLTLITSCTGGDIAATTEKNADPTAAPTEKVTEALTEAKTGPATEAKTEPATEAKTEPVTEAKTEPATEAKTEPVTEAKTEPVTEAKTEPVTEAKTEPVTEPVTEPSKPEYSAGGAGYTPSGHSSEKNGTFTVSKELTLTFESGSFKTDFNRMTFDYTSDQPLHIYVTYFASGREKTDDYYLEAANGAAFKGLISTYLNKTKANGVKSLKITSCTGKQFKFALRDMSVETVNVYNEQTYYLENARFKLGIRLSWGGGVNYIQDKTVTISGLTNLINGHDTGRLIQQSYYGTAGNSEYQPGNYNGGKWVYNPVQGGDQYGNQSRLIDIEVKENSVYIKAQPQDWSLNGKISRSYMENTYTLESDCIRVDNRFVDFSGWEHRYSDQELPAFYTVSYLDRFTWYAGSDPWTDGELSYRDDLQFWGDPRYAPDCRFPVKVGNSETWCSWTSKTDGFGVGLYVPNVDVLYAGKYNYNRSKSSMNDATNYVAPLNTIKMVSYYPIEYGYLITTGTVDQIRATFKAHKDFSDNASLHNNYISARVLEMNYKNIVFDSETAVAALTEPYNTEISYSAEQKAAKLTNTDPNDPQVAINYTANGTALYAEDLQTLEITYMIPESNKSGSYVSDLFLCTGNKNNPDGSERTRVSLIKDGQYHTLTVDLGKLSFWKGKINKIRFDYFDSCAKGDVIFIKSIVLK
ncbi:MAG: hypothetical protein II135_05675 [Clostridia bacterium]|nr:hypothetical protein [Clostridia bacterium]